jgi:hypothetical protein
MREKSQCNCLLWPSAEEFTSGGVGGGGWVEVSQLLKGQSEKF